MPTCSGKPTRIGVSDNFSCYGAPCDVVIEPLPGPLPATCDTQIDPACYEISHQCSAFPSGTSCYTVPYDASADMDSGYLCDKRTPQMIASGCRCLSVDSFSPVSLNLSTGQGAKFPGNISAAGSSLSWTILCERWADHQEDYQRLGQLTILSWTARTIQDKEVSAGDYTATIKVSAAGGWCGDTDTSTSNITVYGSHSTSGPALIRLSAGTTQPLVCVCDSQFNIANGNFSSFSALIYPSELQVHGGI